ncbi:MAG: hypothetical protein IJK98_04305, partial [Clostridia bacterium]|nr:hypothetical protein [Clostridia bacterium]
MPIKVDAAVVTQKRENAAFNSDSVNINGKLLSREAVQNGYKGTGTMSGTVYFSLSSSDIEGFPDAAVAAFNECAEKFKDGSAAPSDVITGYFKDSVYALGEMGHRSSELVSSVLYLSGNTVIMAKSGNTQMYTYSADVLTKVTPALFATEDGAAQYGLCTFPSVSVDDIFLLLSAGVAQVLTDKDIDDICKLAGGSLKKLVNLLSKVAAQKEGAGGISVIAVKVTEADDGSGEEVFGFAAAPRIDESGSAFGADGEASDQLTDPYDRKNRDKDKNKSGKVVVGILAAAVILVILACAVLAVKLFGGTIGSMFGKDKETTSSVTTTTQAPAVTTTRPAVTTTSAVTTTNPVTT